MEKNELFGWAWTNKITSPFTYAMHAKRYANEESFGFVSLENGQA